MGDMEQDTHRERERGTNSISLLATVTTMNNQQQPTFTKCYKLILYSDSLTQMARTWAIKEDSVNTSIIHWYSTDS